MIDVECRSDRAGMIVLEERPDLDPLLKVCTGEEWVAIQERVYWNEELHGWKQAEPEGDGWIVLFVFVLGLWIGWLLRGEGKPRGPVPGLGYQPAPPSSPPWGGRDPRPPSEVR